MRVVRTRVMSWVAFSDINLRILCGQSGGPEGGVLEESGVPG